MNYRRFLFEPSRPSEERDSLSEGEAREDVAFLVEALDKAYPAKWVMGQEAWKEAMANLAGLVFQESVGTNEFGEALANTLWANGRFPKIPGDDKEFIPLPAEPPTVNPPGTIM